MTELIVIAICLVLNALLSAFETAFVSISKPELRLLVKGGKSEARRLLTLRDKPERTLSVIQIGITLVGAISAAVGGAGAEENLAPLFESWWGLKENVAEAISIGVVVLPLTYFSVVLGELVPKTLALKYPMKISLTGLRPVLVADQVLGPLVTFLETSTRFFLRPFTKRASTADSESHESDNLNISTLPGTHKQYIVNLFHIEMRKIRDIMLPWPQVTFIDFDSTLGHVLQTVVASGHTRIPVMKEGQVIGIINSKEFLTFVASGELGWQQVIRNPIVVSPEAKLLATLKMMQEQKKHMAIVMSGGDLEGIVTLEDIMEEVIGEVNDEDDDGRVRQLISNRSHLKSSKGK
ncbi:Magnesium and cobalt efflux protein CorC [compost metagenome]